VLLHSTDGAGDASRRISSQGNERHLQLYTFFVATAEFQRCASQPRVRKNRARGFDSSSALGKVIRKAILSLVWEIVSKKESWIQSMMKEGNSFQKRIKTQGNRATYTRVNT